MKKLILTIVLSCAVVGAFAQGKVNFSTFNFAAASSGPTGQLIPTGPAYWAQLFYGPSNTTDWAALTQMTNNPVHFALAGYVFQSLPYYTDNAIVRGGDFGVFQVRAWAAVLGDTWSVAYNAWLTGPADNARILGKSNLATIKTADATITPPATPASLQGKNAGEMGVLPFTLDPVPEPGVLALGVLGLVALLWRRRQ